MGSKISDQEALPICWHMMDSIIPGALDVDDDIQNAAEVAIVLIT